MVGNQLRVAAYQSPLANDLVTTIVGFTERSSDLLCNSAAVFHRGAVIGIGYDSSFPELAGQLRAPGASALFVPWNNGMPPDRGGAELVELARAADRHNAVENSLWVVRPDVAGHDGACVSYGSSPITHPQERLICASTTLSEDLPIAQIVVSSGTDRNPRARSIARPAPRHVASPLVGDNAIVHQPPQDIQNHRVEKILAQSRALRRARRQAADHDRG